ncbi:oligogalacturonate-specific porin KdgM family protein [Vibrio cyclitrophicus]
MNYEKITSFNTTSIITNDLNCRGLCRFKGQSIKVRQISIEVVLLVGHHFDNGYGLETLTNVRHAAGAYDETKVINTEFTHYYTYAINDNFMLNPGVVMNFRSNTFLMPYLKLNYNFDNGLFVHGRYRYDFSTEALVNHYGNEDTAKRNRYDIWTGYNTDKYMISYAFTYFDQITHHTTELATGDLNAREHTVKRSLQMETNSEAIC